MGSRGGLPLYWTVCLTNAAMFVIAAVVLVVSPATVSEQVTVPEITVVVVGVVVIVLANAALLRGQLLPSTAWPGNWTAATSPMPRGGCPCPWAEASSGASSRRSTRCWIG